MQEELSAMNCHRSPSYQRSAVFSEDAEQEVGEVGTLRVGGVDRMVACDASLTQDCDSSPCHRCSTLNRTKDSSITWMNQILVVQTNYTSSVHLLSKTLLYVIVMAYLVNKVASDCCFYQIV